ncbi:MAG: oligosaccharide flippase family protein [Bacteroidota bacterium]
MQKKFIANLGFLLLLNLLVKPFWLFGIDRAVQNVTGAEAYGHYYALFNFSLLLNILLDLGITNFNNRNISMNRQLLQKHISGIILLRLVLACFYIIISSIIALAIGYTIEETSILLILLINQVLISGILYLRSNLAGLHMFKHDSFISVLDRGLMILICGWLLWGRVGGPPFQIDWFVYAQTASYVITLFVILAMLSGKVSFNRIKWNKAFSLMILRKSYPFAALILLMTFYNRVDSVMLERLLENGAVQAGIYAQAYRLMEAGNMVAFLFAGLLLPIFSHMIKSKSNIEPLLKTSTSLMLVPALGVAIVYIFNNVEIMDALYKYNARESAQVGVFLMVSFVGMCVSYNFGALLTANGNLGALNKLAASAMAFNIILNLALIPKMQANGAAIASMTTQLLMALGQILLAMKLFKISINKAFIFRLIIFIILTILSSMWVSKLDWDLDLPMSHTLASAFLAFVLALFTKAINIGDLLAIWRQQD